MEDLVLSAISADSFWVVNKPLAQAIGIEEAVFTAELLFKYRYWKARGLLDDQGGFFYTSEDIQLALGIGEKPVGRLTKSVLDQGIFYIKKRGVPAKNYWYPQWSKLHDILSHPQTGVTGDPQKGATGHPQKGVAITKESYQVNKTKKIADGKTAAPALSRRISDLIGEAHKHLTGSELVWNGHAAKYGKAIKTIIDTVGKGKPEDEAYQFVREKCAAYVSAAKSDEFLKKQGVTPVSILSNWNKVHYKAKAGQSGLGATKFPNYRAMSVDEIKLAFSKWNKNFTTLDLKAHISPESYERFTREANGYAPALADILVEEVHGNKKTA